MVFLSLIVGGAFLYILLTLVSFFLVHQFPRNPVIDRPDWGSIADTKIETIDGRKLELWRIEPDGDSRGVVVLAHGWGRNRDRMVNRARLYGGLNFTTVIHSARDHGNSSPKKMMTALRFAEDIEAVIKWVDEPVILHGHSAGSAGVIIVASRNSDTVKSIVLESCYPDTREALLGLYRWVNPFFGRFFGPMILFWMKVFYRDFDKYHPANLAREIHMPALIIHGEKDRRFPVAYAHRLKDAFHPGQADLFISKGAGHSDSSLKEGYSDAIRSFVER
jgi:uncharacterized protein